MPRSIWNGTITFGLVNVPIKLYSATESKAVHFQEVHAKDGARTEHRRICPKEEREVPYKQIVKGYEVAPGEYVVLDKEEIKAAAGDRGKVVHLEEFVDGADVDPVFYERTYYVGPRDDADAYRFLHEALRRSGRAGIGRFTFHDREYLAAGRKPSKREVQMAGQLVDSLYEDFDPRRYEDTYREAVLDLIKRKAAGEEIDLLEQEEPEQGEDLAAALQASLAAGR
jgi:DNA end-binding protein Ku